VPYKKRKVRRTRSPKGPKSLDDLIGLTVDSSRLLIHTSVGLKVATEVSKAIKR